MANHHYIGKQMLQLDIHGASIEPSVLEKVAQLQRTQVVPSLEALFDSIVDEDEWISLDVLEIDLGSIALDLIEKEWTASVLFAFKRAHFKVSLGTFPLILKRTLNLFICCLDSPLGQV